MTRLEFAKRMDFPPTKVLRILYQLALQPNTITHFWQLVDGEGVRVPATSLNGIRLSGGMHTNGFYNQVSLLMCIPRIQELLGIRITQAREEMYVTIALVPSGLDARENPYARLDDLKAFRAIDVRQLVADHAGGRKCRSRRDIARRQQQRDTNCSDSLEQDSRLPTWLLSSRLVIYYRTFLILLLMRDPNNSV